MGIMMDRTKYAFIYHDQEHRGRKWINSSTRNKPVCRGYGVQNTNTKREKFNRDDKIADLRTVTREIADVLGILTKKLGEIQIKCSRM